MAVLSTIEGLSSSMASCMFVRLPIPEGDLSQQTIIVTGSNQGLGFEASRHFLRLGVHRLIMAVRNMKKGEAARLELLKLTGRDPSTIEVWELNMDSYSSVMNFAARAKTLSRLDALLANAGLATETFEMVEDNERTITVNVVSTFLLVILLIPKLRESAQRYSTNTRISIVNSALHYMAPISEIEGEGKAIFSRLNDENTAQMSLRYPLSKLLVLFGVRALADRLSKEEPLVILNAPNPSWCKSQLMRENESVGVRVGERFIARSTEMGSRALGMSMSLSLSWADRLPQMQVDSRFIISVHGILSGLESSGQYIDNCQIKRYVQVQIYWYLKFAWPY